MNIKTIIKPRQGGKTTDLLKMSAETGYPIIVKNRDDGRALKKRAKEMALTIPEPISFAAMMRGNEVKIDTDHVLIDDADVILELIMQRLIKCDVAALTMVTRNDKGHEVTIYGEDLNEVMGLPD